MRRERAHYHGASLYSHAPPLLSPSISPSSPTTPVLELHRTMFLAITAAWEAAMDASRGAADALDAGLKATRMISSSWGALGAR